MTDKPENPAAFPLFVPESECPKEYNAQGMDLRDYFAAKAMHANLSDPACETWNYDRHSEQAYLMADAMLKARQHGK